MSVQSGTLFIVATPIGHLDDFTQRARDTLQAVRCIYAEDTRHSQHLLNHYHIRTSVLSLHEHNEKDRVESIVAKLQAGEDLAIISDAGTPLISDPGYRVVSHCLDHGLTVSPVPGASAVMAALCSSGLATDSFVFCGFAPAKSVARRQWLENLLVEGRTAVFFESRHRIVATLTELAEIAEDSRQVTVAREMTKRFETIRKGTAQQQLQWIQADALQQKGEFVVLLGAPDAQDADRLSGEEQEATRLLHILRDDMSVRRAAECVAKITGLKRNRVYKLALQLADDKDQPR